jgi:FAD dependent oxidoreductase TIGR03364
MIQQVDVAVIGGGIAGLAHAWMAARRGLRVALVERTAAAQGASIRNFGMIWPIGQPAGELHSIALRSRSYWLELRQAGVLEVQECGSVHLAHHADEHAVLEEFRDLEGHDVRLLTPHETAQCAPLANLEGLRAAMRSESELRVNPRVASARIAGWLAERLGVACCFNTPITNIEGNTVRAASGSTWQADRIIICSGSDLQTLFPGVLQACGLKRCKLQMLKSVAQPEPFRQDAHLASGLTLRHYASFQGCPTLPALKARIARDTPELDRYGVHVMASPFPDGEVIMGDSHEYGDDVTPFDKSEIDDLMLRELRKVFRLGDWTIQQRWHGIYVKHPELPVVEAECMAGVHAFVGTGGAGMTMAFGLADRTWKRWTGE